MDRKNEALNYLKQYPKMDAFIRVESFCFILSSWKKFWLNRGWNDDKI